MKTKQEIIQEAWGLAWPIVKNIADSNGYVYGNFQYEHPEFPIEYEGYELIRPKSLASIETNNGWIRIYSGYDLPKEDDRMLYEAGYLDSQGNFHEMNMYYFGFQLKYDLYKNLITHYRIKEDRKPPIY